MMDMVYISGFVLVGVLSNLFDYCDVVIIIIYKVSLLCCMVGYNF